MRLIQSVFFLLLGASPGLNGGKPWARGRDKPVHSRVHITAPDHSPLPAFRSRMDCAIISTMLNERDGGVGGVKLNVEGMRKLVTTRRRASSAMSGREDQEPRWSSILIPLARPLSSSPKQPSIKFRYYLWAMGLSASAVGGEFPWIFNPPATYWDAMSIVFKYIGGREGGLDKLKGKTIGYIFPRRRLWPRADSNA